MLLTFPPYAGAGGVFLGRHNFLGARRCGLGQVKVFWSALTVSPTQGQAEDGVWG